MPIDVFRHASSYCALPCPCHETRTLLHTSRTWKKRWLGHILQHDSLVKLIMCKREKEDSDPGWCQEWGTIHATEERRTKSTRLKGQTLKNLLLLPLIQCINNMLYCLNMSVGVFCSFQRTTRMRLVLSPWRIALWIDTIELSSRRVTLWVDTGCWGCDNLVCFSGIPQYIDNLRTVLQKTQAFIKCVIITHHHHDHIGGKLPPPILLRMLV